MRPLGEVLETVMVDRGGAPLHFVLTHGLFAVDASAEALRWLSVVSALAAVPLCFDLGRRLGGYPAGLVAAAVTASSTALAVYGSFGRMYALYVLVAALATDLFVRALELRTRGAVIAAAVAAWLLPAVHPYGAIPALVMLVVAAIVWRRRAWPFGVAAVAAVPFLAADLQLADRSDVGEGGSSLAGPGRRLGRARRRRLVVCRREWADARSLHGARSCGPGRAGDGETGRRGVGRGRRSSARALHADPGRFRARPLAAPPLLRPAALGRGDRRRGRQVAPMAPRARVARRRWRRDRAGRRCAGERARGSARAWPAADGDPALGAGRAR